MYWDEAKIQELPVDVIGKQCTPDPAGQKLIGCVTVSLSLCPLAPGEVRRMVPPSDDGDPCQAVKNLQQNLARIGHTAELDGVGAVFIRQRNDA